MTQKRGASSRGPRSRSSQALRVMPQDGGLLKLAHRHENVLQMLALERGKMLEARVVRRRLALAQLPKLLPDAHGEQEAEGLVEGRGGLAAQDPRAGRGLQPLNRRPGRSSRLQGVQAGQR